MIAALLLAPLWAADHEGVLAASSVSTTDDVKLRYYRDRTTLPDFPDYNHLFDYVELVNRLNLVADAERWQAGTQADVLAILGGYYYLDDQRVNELALHGEGVDFPLPLAYANLEKIWFTGRFGQGNELQVGDGYTAFGRGLALNLVRNTDIDVDTSLRGAQLILGGSRWDLKVLSGFTNPQQILQDNPNVQLRPDRTHLINGARANLYGAGPANLGAHVVTYTFSRELSEGQSSLARFEQPLDAVVGGASVELLGLLRGDWFVEGDAFGYRSGDLFRDGEAKPGYAVYGSTAYYPGRLAILVEGKRTVNTERLNAFTSAEGYEVASGPTLEYERVITEDSSAAVNSDDLWGGRVRVDIAANPGVMTPYVSVAAFRDEELGGLHFNRSPETIVHPMVGMDWLAEDIHVLVNAGFRQDIRDPGGNGEDYGADSMAHADLSFGFLAGPIHGELDGSFQQFWWGENQNQQHDFTVVSVAAAGHMPHDVTVVLYGDYSNDPLIDSVGNISDSVYGAAEVQVQPFEGATVKAFYGAYRAGIRCAGGQCRKLPGFEGARLSASFVF